MVAAHLGEDVKDLPYLPKSTASSSNYNPNPAKPAEDKPPRSRTRSQGRPPKTNPEIPSESGASGGTAIKTQKVREDTGGENTKRLGRSRTRSPTQAEPTTRPRGRPNKLKKWQKT